MQTNLPTTINQTLKNTLIFARANHINTDKKGGPNTISFLKRNNLRQPTPKTINIINIMPQTNNLPHISISTCKWR
jgi:hypothetical protein